MTETTATETAESTEPKLFTASPKLIHESLARYINKHSDDSVGEVSPQQAQALLSLHKQWQASDDRKQEREQEEAERAIAAAKRKEELEQKKAEAKAKKEAEDAAKKAKKAAAGEDSDALDDLDGDDALDDLDGDEAPKPKRAPRKKAAPKAEPKDELSDDDL